MPTTLPRKSVRGIKLFRADTMLTSIQRATVESIVAMIDEGIVELRWGSYIGQPETPYTVCHNGRIHSMVYKDGFVR